MNDIMATSIGAPTLFDRDLLFFPERIVEPASWAGHVPFAAWLVAKLKPACLVELGTHTGFSYSSFCQAVQQHGLPTRCYAVDTWQGDEHAGHYDSALFDELQGYHDARYAGFSRLMRMTFDDALPHFSEGSIELLHIDGLHTYEAVKHDFETWLPKVCPERGVILFHDTNVRQGDFGVWKLWDELCLRYPHISFDHSHGLGVLLVGSALPESLRGLAACYQEDPSLVKGLFARLGQTVEQAAALRRQQQLLDERQAMIRQREALVAERDAWLTEHNERREFLEGLVVERDEQLREHQEALVGCRQALADAEQALADTRQTLQTMSQSLSWRVTSPLRAVRHWFK